MEIDEEPRIRPLTLDELAPELRPIFERSLARNGYVNNGNWIAAHCPAILLGLRGYAEAIESNGLISRRIHALVSARVAQVVGCPY